MNDWLPSLCLFDDFERDWQKYEDHLYSRFRRDFIISPPRVAGQLVQINTAPYLNARRPAASPAAGRCFVRGHGPEGDQGALESNGVVYRGAGLR